MVQVEIFAGSPQQEGRREWWKNWSYLKWLLEDGE